VTVAVVLAACRDAGDLVLGRWLEDWVKSAGIEVGSLVGSALVGMYEKCGEMGEARRVFDGIADKDNVAWNAMITGQVSTHPLVSLVSRKKSLMNVLVSGLIICLWYV
jgi:hypothetical protein